MLEQLEEHKELSELKVREEHENQLLHESRKAMLEAVKLLKTAQNPYILGRKRNIWEIDRSNTIEYLTRMMVKIRGA